MCFPPFGGRRESDTVWISRSPCRVVPECLWGTPSSQYLCLLLLGGPELAEVSVSGSLLPCATWVLALTFPGAVNIMTFTSNTLLIDINEAGFVAAEGTDEPSGTCYLSALPSSGGATGIRAPLAMPTAQVLL